MRYIVDNGLNDFEAWAGGKQRLDGLKDHCRKTGDWDAFDYLESYLNDYTDSYETNGEFVTDTDINDFLWFESDEVLQEAGYLDENLEWKKADDDE